jgi:DNA-binding transcriptional ArsR family regulator
LVDNGEATVQELSDALGLARPATSKHLSALFQAGFIERRRDGKAMIYGRVGHPARDMLDAASQHVAAYAQQICNVVEVAPDLAQDASA